MKDEQKAKLFHDLVHFDLFKVQVGLEDQQIESLQSKLLTIDPKSDVKFEYARVRGSLEALKGLKAIRDKLVEDHRSRSYNS